MPSANTLAVVSRPTLQSSERVEYLVMPPESGPAWTADLAAATTFPSMREAMRAALRLPSANRAFGLPLRSELTASVH